MASPIENVSLDEIGLGSEIVSQEVGMTELGQMDSDLDRHMATNITTSSSPDGSLSMSPEFTLLMSKLCSMEKEMSRVMDEKLNDVKHEIDKVNKKMDVIQKGLEEKYDNLFYTLEKKFIDVKIKVTEDIEDIDVKVDGAMEEIKDIHVKIDDNGKKLEEVRREISTVEEKRKLVDKNYDESCNGLKDAILTNTKKIHDLETRGVAVVTGSTINANDNGVGDQLLREGIVFMGDEGLHPIEFLNLLESRFKNYSVSSHRRLAFTLQCMKGQCVPWMGWTSTAYSHIRRTIHGTTSVAGENAYELETDDGISKDVFNVINLKEYKSLD